MDKHEFTTLIEQPQLLKADHLSALKSLIERYPYLQSAKALYLKGLKNTDSYKYNNSLKTTAAYTTDRSVLFDFITSEEFNQNSISKNIRQNSEYLKALDLNEVDDISINKSVIIDEALKDHIKSTEGVLDPELFEKKETPVNDGTPIIAIDVKNITAEEQLDLGKPLEFDHSETHSFAEWLKITDFKPIDRSEDKEEALKDDSSAVEAPISSKLSIIDKFIEDNPKIIPKDNSAPQLVNNDTNWAEEGLMTETLARIYLEQKNYEKAIQSFRILSLKYPEKSSFFADQIKAVEEIKLRNKI